MIKMNPDDWMIECKDIVLRPYKVEDLEALCELTREPEIVKFLPDWNVSREQRLDWLINYETVENKQFLDAVACGGNVGQLRLRLGIILRVTGEFIGWCCTGTKEELPPPNREIMFAISGEHRNKGYMTQAVQGMIRFLFEHTDVEVLNAVALIQNVPSNKVIQKCGFELSNRINIQRESYYHYMMSKQL